MKKLSIYLFGSLSLFVSTDRYWMSTQCLRTLRSSDVGPSKYKTKSLCRPRRSAMSRGNPPIPWRVWGTLSPPHRTEAGVGWSSSAPWCVTLSWTELGTPLGSSSRSGWRFSGNPAGRFLWWDLCWLGSTCVQVKLPCNLGALLLSVQSNAISLCSIIIRKYIN